MLVGAVFAAWESVSPGCIKRKKVQFVWIGTRADSGSPWVALWWQFELRLCGISSGFPLASHLICLVHSPYLVHLRILPDVCMHLLAKMALTTKAYG